MVCVMVCCYRSGGTAVVVCKIHRQTFHSPDGDSIVSLLANTHHWLVVDTNISVNDGQNSTSLSNQNENHQLNGCRMDVPVTVVPATHC